MRSESNNVFEYKIPPETDKFGDMLEELTVNKKPLRIENMGLSLTTMEQVFLRYNSLFIAFKILLK